MCVESMAWGEGGRGAGGTKGEAVADTIGWPTGRHSRAPCPCCLPLWRLEKGNDSLSQAPLQLGAAT